MERTLEARESPYATFVRQMGLNTINGPGWSGRGNHVEFQHKADVPLVMDEVLGHGGHAVVQKVIRKSDDKRALAHPLAQKIIRNYKPGLENTMQEVKNIQNLRHRHIIQLVGTYVVDKSLYILLYPVGQWNLKDFLSEFQDVKMNHKAWREFCSIATFFKCLSYALEYLHNEITPHIKHLDIKPQNIIVRRYSSHGITVLLTDFGVSRSFHPADTSQDAATLYTTPDYAAPEVAHNKSFGRLADIFSLGCVFSEMASVLGGKSLLEYSNHRRCERAKGLFTIAFEKNLKACISWLEALRENAPFSQLSINDSSWWTRLLKLIEEMLSETASDRPDSGKLVKHFPDGACCDVPSEKYSLPPHPFESISGAPETLLQDTLEQVPLATPRPPATAPAPLQQTVALSPPTQPSISNIRNGSKGVSGVAEVDWSGKGPHVGYSVNEPIPLKDLEVISLGSSVVTKVRSTRCGPYIFAKKTLEKGERLLQLEMLLQEVKMLQTLRNPHIVRLIGTLDEQRFFSILIYPAAEWNLRSFMKIISSTTLSEMRETDLGIQKKALSKFYKCLIQGLHYLHSQNVRHEDIKPNNILVQHIRSKNDYHIYLADFGLSTKFEYGHGSQTAGMTGHTPIYASPEVLSGSKHGRASDIFSMGCVWLEMYTVLLGDKLEYFEQHRIFASESSEAEPDNFDNHDAYQSCASYAKCLFGVRSWIDRLVGYCKLHGSLILGGSGGFATLGFSGNEIIAGLHDVIQMLQEDPRSRPNAAALCQKMGDNPCCRQDVMPLKLAEGYTKMGMSTQEGEIVVDFFKAGEGRYTDKWEQASPPETKSTLPFRRDEDFVGREAILQQVDHKLANPPSLRRVALIGLGGVGKSQMAIEYAYRMMENFPGTHVFWVNADSSTRFEQSYRSIAAAANLPALDNPDTNINRLVFRWLQCNDSGKWLVILDNADNADVLSKLDGEKREPGYPMENMTALSGYLPQNPHGAILVTSRNRYTALQLVGREDRIIHVHDMLEEECVALIQRKLPYDQSNREDIIRLISALERLPLAITQAAAYIAVKAPRMTISRYLKYFETNEKIQMTLLSMDRGDLRRDPVIPNAVLVTWHISFEQIKEQNSSAASLLSQMCVLDRQGIPGFLLCNTDGDSSEFEKSIETLMAFSFVKAEKDELVFQMHPLVQLSTRKWLEMHDEIEQRKEEVLNLVSKKYPNGEYENWDICEALEPHVQVLLSYRHDSPHSRMKRARILHKSARYFLVRGDFEISEARVKDAVKIRQELFGFTDRDTLDSSSLLASVLNVQGHWKKAEEQELQVLETRKRMLGEKHPDTITSLASLAFIYRTQGQWKKAERLHGQIMKIGKRELGQEHPFTLKAMTNLASTYRNQGRWKEAEKLHVQVMKIGKTELGDAHPDTLASMANLASTYQNQGRWKEAEKLHSRVIEIQRGVLGEEHPSALTTMESLASTYWNQGRWKEAEELDIQVMEVRKKVLGQEHPNTLRSMANLASTYWNQGRWRETEELDMQVMEIRKRILEQEHPDMLISMADLALTYRHRDQLEKAEELDIQVMEARKKVLGQEHPDTLTSMANLASTYWKQGRLKEAEELDMQVMEMRKKLLGLEHPDTLISMTNLAYTWKSQSQNEKAMELMRQAESLQKEILGIDHPRTINSTQTLCKWQGRRGSGEGASALTFFIKGISL